MRSGRPWIIVVIFAGVIALALLAIPNSTEQSQEIADPAPASVDTAAIEPPISQSTNSAMSDLASAITNACANDSDSSDDEVPTQESLEDWREANRRFMLDLRGRLAASSNSEHLHLSAVFSDDDARRTELFQRAISQSPSDPFIAWNAVRLCAEAGDEANCPMRTWERHLIAIDGQNSEAWVRIAANRYQRAELDAALEAMQYASASAESRAYWTETVAMYERGLAAGSDLAFPERASRAFGLAASSLPRYGDFTNMCREQSAQDAEWASACLNYGELVERQGKTDIGVSVARSIQVIALEALGEPERAREVDRRLQARRQERLDATHRFPPEMEWLVFSDAALFSSYLATIDMHGEVAARTSLAEEIERLIELRPDLTCEPFGPGR